MVVEIEGQQVKMDIDTGAAVTLMSSSSHNLIFPKAKLNHSANLLKTYTGERIPVEGEREAKV